MPPEKATELISGEGEFNEAGFANFINSSKLHDCGVSYAVIAIMGPQSSGKSTLLNHLFHTNFTEMDADSGRSQTTKGIWIGKALHMEPFTMVVDLEGTDGLERGEDDTTFEKQSAVFAIAVADIVLINMWCHDIGREHAANRPLLKTIFEVMMRLFSARRTKLLFIIRDKTKSPFETLETKLRKDVEKIWESVPKPQSFKDTPLSEFFNVEVVALPSYEVQEDEFIEQVAKLRQRISHLISLGGVAGDRRDVVPASEFSFSAKTIWEIIKENKDLNLPAHKIMVATVRCEEIAKEKLRLFASNKTWLAIEQAAETRLVSGFGSTVSSILRRYLLKYDSESIYFEEDVRNAKRQYLESEALKLVHPAYMNTLGHLRWEAFQSFQIQLEALLIGGGEFAASVRTCQQSCVLEFDQRCLDATVEKAKWDSFTVRKELLRDIDAHKFLVRTEKLPQVVDQCRERFSAKLTKQLKLIFVMGGDKDMTWGSIRSLLKRESDAAAAAVSSAVAMYELEQATLDQMVHDLKQYARKLVEKKFKEETGDVLGLMKQRFIIALQEEDTAMREEEDHICRATVEVAYCKALKLLSTMAVLRFDERHDDDVESVLLSTLMGAQGGVAQDPLASSTWEKVLPEITLITPTQCKDIWEQFKLDIERLLPQSKTCRVQKDRSGIRSAWLRLIDIGLMSYQYL